MANRWKPDRQNQWFYERLKSALDRYGACQRIPIKARGNTNPHLEAEYTSAPTRHAKPEFKSDRPVKPLWRIVWVVSYAALTA